MTPQPVTDWTPVLLAAAGAAITAATIYLRREDRADSRRNHPTNHKKGNN